MSGLVAAGVAAVAAIVMYTRGNPEDRLADLESQIVRAKQAGTADTSVVGAPRRDTSAEVEVLQAKFKKLQETLWATPGAYLHGTSAATAKIRVQPGNSGPATWVMGDIDYLQKMADQMNLKQVKMKPAVVSLG